MSPPGAGIARVARAIAIAPIVVYQRVISPAIPRRCKYEPTCSRYAVDAIGRYGILKGLLLAGWRLLRCNPWSYGGYDPVEAQQLFAPRPDGRAERPADVQPADASTKRSSPEHSHSMTAETT